VADHKREALGTNFTVSYFYVNMPVAVLT